MPPFTSAQVIESIQFRTHFGYGEAEPLIALFESIAARESWAAGNQLRANSHSAVHISVWIDEMPIGGVQCVSGLPSASLPCMAVWPEARESYGDRRDVANVTLLALQDDWKAHAAGLMWHLCIRLFCFCQSTGVSELLAEVTPSRLKQYRIIGLPFCVIGDLRLHWGEPCFLCRLSVGEAAAEIQRKGTASLKYKRIVATAYNLLGDAATAPIECGRQ